MLHTTLGIVLKTIKYGETSLICQIFTEKLGKQSYMLKGVRSAKSKNKQAHILYPGAFLDLEAHHNPIKNFQYLKEYKFAAVFPNTRENIVKNCVMQFGIEILNNFIIADDPQEDIFEFTTYFLHILNDTPTDEIGNFPIYLVLQISQLAGYKINGTFDRHHSPYLNIIDGAFSNNYPQIPYSLSKEEVGLASQLNNSNEIELVKNIKMTHSQRQNILKTFLSFLHFHYPNFKEIKSLDILSAILHE